jgi:hypothetical protein
VGFFLFGISYLVSNSAHIKKESIIMNQSIAQSVELTLFAVLSDAQVFLVNGYEITTQINGELIGKPGCVLLGNRLGNFQGVYQDQVVKIDEAGVASIKRFAAPKEQAPDVVRFF